MIDVHNQGQQHQASDIPRSPLPKSWKAEDNFKLNQIPTYLVVDFECMLDEIELANGDKTTLVHYHLLCAWVIVVQTIYPFTPFASTYRCI